MGLTAQAATPRQRQQRGERLLDTSAINEFLSDTTPSLVHRRAAGQPCRDLGALAGRAGQSKLAAKGLHSVGHSPDTRFRHWPHQTVVVDHHSQVAGIGINTNPGGARAGMFGDVRDGLADDVVRGGFDDFRLPWRIDAQVDRNRRTPRDDREGCWQTVTRQDGGV